MKIKILIAILIIAVMISLDFIVITNSVKAVNIAQISSVDLHYGGMCGQLLKYKGVIVKTTFVEHYGEDGKHYPAYCLDKTLGGVTEEFAYTVTATTKSDDIGLWRTIINGYPYKSIDELGVANEYEAFTATKQAVYCYLFENEPEDYEGIGEEGARTLNALRKIVSDARSSTETIPENTVTVNAESKDWKEDDTNKKFISKIYSVNSKAYHSDYEVSFEGTVPKNSIITKLDGTECSKFSSEEKFKIMLPKDELEKSGKISLKIKTEVNTKPVLYGASPDATLQNYAISGYSYEDVEASFNDTYPKVEKPKETPKETPKKTPNETPKETPKQETPKPVEEVVKILPVTGM